MSIFKRLTLWYLIFSLSINPFSNPVIFTQDTIAPFSKITSSIPIKPLTPFQIQVLRDFFIHTEIKSVLDGIVREAFLNLGGEFKSDIEALSATTYHQLLKEDEIKKLNASIADRLLSSIRNRHHTKQNKMFFEKIKPDDINLLMEEKMKVMPTEGVQFFYIQGIYVIAYKEFILFLHSEGIRLEETFPNIYQHGRIVFQERQNSRENLTFVQFATSDDQQTITSKWPIMEFPVEPTEEMKETLDKLREFVPYVTQTLSQINKDFFILNNWISSDSSDSSLNKIKFIRIIKEWTEQVKTINARSLEYTNIREDKTINVIKKISLGLTVLSEMRVLGEEIFSQFQNKDGWFHLDKRSTLYACFDLKKIRDDGNEQLAKEDIDAYLEMLQELSIRIGSKLTKLKTFGLREKVVVDEVLRDVAKEYSFNGVSIEFKSPKEANIKIETKRIYFEWVLCRVFEEILAQLQGDFEATGKKGIKKIEVQYQVDAENLLVKMIPLVSSDSSQNSSIRDLKNTKRFTFKNLALLNWETIQNEISATIEKDENEKSFKLQIPLKASFSNMVEAIPTMPRKRDHSSITHSDFSSAYYKYIKRSVKNLFKSDLIEELNFLNDVSTLSLESLRALGVSLSVSKIIQVLQLNGSEEEFKKMTLRDVSHQTGLRLSEITSLLQIKPIRTSSELKQVTVFTHSNGKQIKNLQQELAQLRFSGDTLILLRLVTPDAAGNMVEQLVIDRLDWIKRFYNTLGNPFSFQTFLFNARRTFDFGRREIVLDEIYLDPQGKGFGSFFYTAQMRALIRSGFVRILPDKKGFQLQQAHVREDAISFETMQWMPRSKIDWEEQRLYPLQQALFQKLRIPVSSGRLTANNLKLALEETKKWSGSFERYLEIKYENDSKKILFLRTSSEDGFVEFLKFRLLGYGRRVVFREKLEQGFNQLPSEFEKEKEEGLQALNDPDLSFWQQIKEAKEKLVQVVEKGELQIDYLPDFSKDSLDRLRLQNAIRDLLHQHEFCLSLVQELCPEDGGLKVVKTKDQWHFDKDNDEKKHSNDEHQILDKMQNYFLNASETVLPNFISRLKGMDSQIGRYAHFWQEGEGWKKPEEHYLKLAMAFHQQIEEKLPDTFVVLNSRLYFPEITTAFLKFMNSRLQPKRSHEVTQPSFAEMAKIFHALFYYDPQLAGIILRSGSVHFKQLKGIIAELPKEMAAKILNFEVIPFPKTQKGIKNFKENDQFILLNLIEPDEVDDFKRATGILKLVEFQTLACILQQAYHKSVSEELIESVLLNAVRNEIAGRSQYTKAMVYLEKELKDSSALKWINHYFESGDSLKEPLSVKQFIQMYKEGEHEKWPEVLGKKYAPAIYRAFMQEFDGYLKLEQIQSESKQTKTASEALSEIFKTQPELAGLIVRSTPDAQDAPLFNLLIGLPQEELIQLLNQEIDFVPLKECERFYALNRYVIYRFIESLFQKIEFASVEGGILKRLSAKSLAALIQHMWLNRDHPRFSLGIKFSLQKLISIIDSSQIDEIKTCLKEWDQKEGSNVARWFVQQAFGAGYSQDFYMKLRASYDEKINKNGKSLYEKTFSYFELNSEVLKKHSNLSEKFTEAPFVFKNLIPLLRQDSLSQDAFNVYGRVKMEMARLLIHLMNDYDEADLPEEDRNLFLFLVLEEELDSFFFEEFKQKGISSLEEVTSGKAILRVKVLPNIPENRGHFQSLKKADLVITNSFPENDPQIKRPGAILLGIPSSVNGHAYELAKAWKIPCAFLPFSDQMLKRLEGEIVVYEVKAGKGEIRLANLEERGSFQKNLPELEVSMGAFNLLEIPKVLLGKNEPFILSGDQLKPTDQRRVGYKAVRLARIKQETGLLVPDFFSVTYYAYQTFLESNNLIPKIKKNLVGIETLSNHLEMDDALKDLKIKEKLSEIKQMILDGVFPMELEKAIEKSLEGLSEELFARSSSNVEDLPNFSGAGTLKSCPTVNKKEEVLKSIKTVWASLWEEAFDIRRAHGIKGEEHLQAFVSVMLQNKCTPVYSGTVATGNKIDITIDEGISQVVDDTYEGQTSPHILFNQVTGKIERPFEDRPKFWNHQELGMALLVDFVKEKLPFLSQDQESMNLRQLIQKICHEDEEQLAQALKSFEAEALAPEFKKKLQQVNQMQAEKIFLPLYEAISSIEKEFRLSPILVEFALERQANGFKVIPLQVKGYEGARRISFDVMILNQMGLHARVIGNLRLLLQKSQERNLFKHNKIYIGYKQDGEKLVEFQEESPKGNMMIDILAFAKTKKKFMEEGPLTQGDILRVEVTGPDALEIGKIIRRFFLMLSLDFNTDANGKIDFVKIFSSKQFYTIPWKEVEKIYSFYVEEDDAENLIPWQDLLSSNKKVRLFNLEQALDRTEAFRSGTLLEIYQALFGRASLQEIPPEIEMAI